MAADDKVKYHRLDTHSPCPCCAGTGWESCCVRGCEKPVEMGMLDGAKEPVISSLCSEHCDWMRDNPGKTIDVKDTWLNGR